MTSRRERSQSVPMAIDDIDPVIETSWGNQAGRNALEMHRRLVFGETKSDRDPYTPGTQSCLSYLDHLDAIRKVSYIVMYLSASHITFSFTTRVLRDLSR